MYTHSFFGGTICNKIGPRLTLSLGSLGYSLYIGSLYSTVISETKSRENFVIAAGAILGMCAGCLWTAQGAFMLSYSTEHTKGKFVVSSAVLQFPARTVPAPGADFDHILSTISGCLLGDLQPWGR